MMIDTEPGERHVGATRKIATALAEADIDAIVGTAVGFVVVKIRPTEAERLAELVRAVHA